jgi:hypothetical protein
MVFEADFGKRVHFGPNKTDKMDKMSANVRIDKDSYNSKIYIHRSTDESVGVSQESKWRVHTVCASHDRSLRPHTLVA